MDETQHAGSVRTQAVSRGEIMPLLPRLSSLWRNLFHKSRREQELTEEIDTYLAMLIEQKIEQGLDPEEARRAALIEIGGKQQLKDRVWDVSVGNQLVILWQDLRYALRMMRRNPGFTAVAVLSLALGIGANTAIFSLVDAVLLKMLPVKDPEQLVFLEKGGIPKVKDSRNLSYAFFERLRAQRDLLAGVCTFNGISLNVVVDGQADLAEGQWVSGNFFAVLGVHALLGRIITEDDDKVPGGHPVVVISYNYWQQRFARDPAIVGKSIAVNGHPFTIIGVTPPDFFGVWVGDMPALWAPSMMYAQLVPGQSIEEYFNSTLYHVLARLRPEVTEQQASAVLTGLLHQSSADTGTQLSGIEPQSLRRLSVALIPASKGLSSLREQFSEPLRILMFVVGLVLLIACANVANLLLARATARRKEIAVRLALGAGRLRLIRQLLTESILLALTGGALGLLFAWWGSNFLLGLVRSGRDPVSLKLTLDVRVLGFTAAASLLAGILFGLAPAWRATRVDLIPSLKDSIRSSGAGARMGLGKALVLVQVALSLLLLIGSGLFVRSLGKLKSLDAGFNRENVLLVSTDPQIIGYQGRKIADLYQRILERIKAIPGVRSASFSSERLVGGGGSVNIGTVHVRGRPVRPHENTYKWAASGTMPTTPVCHVGPEYFETVGMTILRGRGFTAQDDENTPRVAIVNETFASHYFGDEDPLGQRFSFDPNSDGFEIIGIVKDAKYETLRQMSLPMYYLSHLQYHASRETTFLIRTAADPAGIITAVREAVREVDANLPLFDIKTLAMQVDESLVQERLIGTVSSFFGLLSLLLAAIGLYGIMAYVVNQRTHEIGIRMALGAQRGAVLRMVMGQGMKLVLIGMALGLAASFAATRLVASYLFGITPTDPVTFVGVPMVLLIVALLACFIPARRASRVDPMVALRDE
jgi:predicted permease